MNKEKEPKINQLKMMPNAQEAMLSPRPKNTARALIDDSGLRLNLVIMTFLWTGTTFS